MESRKRSHSKRLRRARFEGRWRASQPGAYHAEIVFKKNGEPVDRQSLSTAAGYPLEFQPAPPNEKLLRGLAEATGGAFNPAPEEIWKDKRSAVEEKALWPWLASLALLLFMADVAIKRWPRPNKTDAPGFPETRTRSATMKRPFLAAIASTIAASSILHAEPLPQPVLERYEQMLLAAPEPGTAFDKIYQHYLETEGLDALEKRWNEAAQKDEKTRGDYFVLIGLLDDRRGKSDEAIAILRQAADAAPGWRPYAALAASQAAAGKLRDAVETYKKSIDAKPPADALSKLYHGLALCQQRLMDSDGAAATWLAYAKTSGEDPFVLDEAGEALIESERYDDARGLYEKLRDAKDADPARKLNASLKLAEIAQAQGRKDDALKIYSAALADAGSEGWLQRDIRQRIERLFRADDDLPGLVSFYQGRLKADPNDLESALSLADTLGELNRDDEAIQTLQAAAAKARDRKDIPLKLADALLAAQRPQEAEENALRPCETIPERSVDHREARRGPVAVVQACQGRQTARNRDLAFAGSGEGGCECDPAPRGNLPRPRPLR